MKERTGMKMIKGCINLAVLMYVLATAHVCAAQTLWNGTTLGMSVDQVRKSVPNVHEPESAPGSLGTGAKELLRLDDVELAGHTFHAAFYFLGRSLSQVSLVLDNPPSLHGAMLIFDSITDALRAKYGHELSKDTHPGLLAFTEAHWLSGRTNITLMASGVADNPAILNIIYQVRIAKDADKL
jgi:hypothetical protein